MNGETGCAHRDGKIGWKKSALSTANGQCVEVAAFAGGVLVRDSKDPDGPRLRLTRAAWRAFLSRVAAD